MENAPLPLSQDAALVLALAGTAIPFAHSAEDEAERWLRAMRLHGDVGKLMQALGVGESPLESDAEPQPADTPPFGESVLERVSSCAANHAAEREADSVATGDLMLGVIDVYGELFERVLYVRGTSSQELIEHLGDEHPARSAG
jgi:hypothetical protein